MLLVEYKSGHLRVVLFRDSRLDGEKVTRDCATCESITLVTRRPRWIHDVSYSFFVARRFRLPTLTFRTARIYSTRERKRERKSRTKHHGYHHVLFLIDSQCDSQVSSKLKFKPINRDRYSFPTLCTNGCSRENESTLRDKTFIFRCTAITST